MSVFNSPFNQVFHNPFGSPFNGDASSGTTWTPAEWFLASEQGIWLDPSDFTRYMGEKGPELAIQETSINKTADGTLFAGLLPSNAANANKWFEFTCTVTTASGVPTVHFNGGGSSVAIPPGTTGVFRAVIKGGTSTARIGGTTTDRLIASNFVLRELTAINTATMFQDSVGTTPVTAVEQPVGLGLDKRLGLVEGPELVTNGTFDTDTAGWSGALNATISAVGGRLRVTATGTPSLAQYSFPTVVGRAYRIRANYVPGTVATPMFRAGSTVLGTEYFSLVGASVTGYIERIFIATGTTAYVCAGSSGATAGQYADFDSISVKHLPGNHASQPTTAQKPVLSARVNMLTQTEDFSNITWTKANITANYGHSSPLGGLTATRLTAVAGTFQSTITGGAADLTAGQVIRTSVYVKAGTHNYVQIGTAHFAAYGGVWRRVVFDLSTGGVVVNNGITDPTIEDVGGGWYRISASATVSATTTGASLFSFKLVTAAGAENGTWAGTESVFVWGAQFKSEAADNRYQRVTTATDYDTVGFPHYLKFDGVDDFLSTGNIDFTATDKMTEVLGISVNNGTFGVIHELSASLASNTGAFGRFSGIVSSRHYPTVIRGTTAVAGYAGMASSTQPDLCVLSATHDIAGDLTRARRNGVYGVDENTDKGTGNLGNYPLYIGRRGGTSSPANMNLYQFVLRGAATDAAGITAGETFTAGKTGITL